MQLNLIAALRLPPDGGLCGIARADVESETENIVSPVRVSKACVGTLAGLDDVAQKAVTLVAGDVGPGSEADVIGTPALEVLLEYQFFLACAHGLGCRGVRCALLRLPSGLRLGRRARLLSGLLGQEHPQGDSPNYDSHDGHSDEGEAKLAEALGDRLVQDLADSDLPGLVDCELLDTDRAAVSAGGTIGEPDLVEVLALLGADDFPGEP